MHLGYELFDSGRGEEHRVGYHKLISNKREWNNCFIKYQTLDFVYVEVKSVNPCKLRDCILLLTVSIAEFFAVSFHIWTNSMKKDLYRQ